MKKRIVLIFLSVSICAVSYIHAQDTIEMWTKISPEIRVNIENSPWEFRLRPDDHIFLPVKYVRQGSLARIDLMIGINFWKFKLFSYTKWDQDNGLWTGPRLDFNFEIFDKKLLFNIQERYFFGLNEQSKDHYYLIQYIRYQISDMSALGVLSYGKWGINQDIEKGIWFVGPSFEVAEKSGMSLQLAFTKDVFHEPVYMTYVKLGYKFMIRDRSKPITIDDE